MFIVADWLLPITFNCLLVLFLQIKTVYKCVHAWLFVAAAIFFVLIFFRLNAIFASLSKLLKYVYWLS